MRVPVLIVYAVLQIQRKVEPCLKYLDCVWNENVRISTDSIMRFVTCNIFAHVSTAHACNIFPGENVRVNTQSTVEVCNITRKYTNTVEPPNNRHIGSGALVRYLKVVLISEGAIKLYFNYVINCVLLIIKYYY